IIVGGHCGIPFIERRRDKLWVNAGVIGMPANDGTRRGWYLLARESEEDLQFSLCPFDYDSEQAARLMDELNLPCEYASTLRTGLWCSLDNLPRAPERPDKRDQPAEDGSRDRIEERQPTCPHADVDE